MSNVVRHGDYVLPHHDATITVMVGCGLMGWTDRGEPARLTAIDGANAELEFALAPIGFDRGRKPARFNAPIAKLRTVNVALIPRTVDP